MKKLGLLILVSALMAFAAAAQSEPHDLQLIARVTPSVSPALAEIVVTFLNTTGHALSFPKPFLFCHGLPGAMMVVSKFKPADPNSEQPKYGMGCAACNGIRTSELDILEQTKDWIVLGPGQTVDIQGRISNAMVIGEAGTYRLHVIYSAPSFDAQDRKKLRAAGVHLPSKGDYDSDTVTFEIEPSQPDAN